MHFNLLDNSSLQKSMKGNGIEVRGNGIWSNGTALIKKCKELFNNNIYSWRYYTQHNDIQHNNTQSKRAYKWRSAWVTFSTAMLCLVPIVGMLNVTFHLLLCWVSLCWMSLCWVSWRLYSYLETSGGQSYNLYLNVVHFFNTSLN